MRKWMFVFLAFVLAVSCQDNATSSKDDKELEVDASLQDQVALGYQVNQYVSTGDEIEQMTSGFNDPAPNTGMGFVQDQQGRIGQTLAAYNQIRPALSMPNSLFKVQGEVEIFQTDTTNEFGDKVRTALLIDVVEGTMRFYIVTYEFAERTFQGRNFQTNMVYDSTEIKFVFTGEDFENVEPTQLYVLQRFKEDFALQSVETVLDITSFVNEEVTAFTSKTLSIYGSDSRLDSTVVTANFQVNGTSTLTQTFYFKDGTSRSNTVTFNTDNTGSFTRTLRNGVTVSGSFDQVEDDGVGSYEATWTFPAGNYLKSIFRTAAVTADTLAGLFNANFFEKITFATNEIDSSRIIIAKDFFQGVATYDITRRNGAHGKLTVQELDEVSIMTGYWVTYDSFYVDIRAEYYSDRSAYLTYSVYENQAAFESGEDPLVVAEYNFDPDGGATGTVTSAGKTYEVELDETGVGSMLLNGARKAINMYR